MPHLVLLGDSILDNGAYTDGGPAVIDHVQQLLPQNWRGTLLAVDGSTTNDIPDQIAAIPSDASALVLSVGGNNALLRAEVLESPVSSSGEALLMLAKAVDEFEPSYRRVVGSCLQRGLPLVLCTIYNGNFPEPTYQRRATLALTAYNDVILRVGTEHQLTVIDLRLVCSSPSDYANPIEPSASGGAKIARAIITASTQLPRELLGARVIAA